MSHTHPFKMSYLEPAWKTKDDRTSCTKEKLKKGNIKRKIEIMKEKQRLKRQQAFDDWREGLEDE